jgi:phenylpropionate dioxygenase-like ring-hydroxylating dioxygenase large terminal subunit
MDLAVWRDKSGSVACVQQRCPHRGAALSAGRVVDGEVACPFHGFRFDPQGSCTLAPCNGRAQVPGSALRSTAVPMITAHGFVFAWLGEGEPDAAGPRFFDDLGPDLVHAGSHETWRAHYSRMIENQLDVAHLPFVHANTIGRGGRSLVDGPLVEWLGPDRFRVYVFNRVDDGTLPRRAADLSRPNVPFHLEFVYPNLWQNHISDRVRVVAAFAPVDDRESVLYLRFYQHLALPRALGRLVCRLAMPANTVIARQDKRVVETQTPLRSLHGGGEKLVPADAAVIAYRRRRAELQRTTPAAGAAETPVR